MSSIEEARKSWEKETEKSLVTFQSLEEDRLAHIRDSLWRVANISSLAAVADDLAAEEVRKTLEVSKLDDAIQGTVRARWQTAVSIIFSFFFCLVRIRERLQIA